MSETQDVQFIESNENSDTESSRPRSEMDELKESNDPYGSETPKSENTPTLKSDEPEKNVVRADWNAKSTTNSAPGSTDQQPQQQQSRPGECNLLPVLVERLRSILEFSCSSRSNENQLPLENSDEDSEQNLQNWAPTLRTFLDKNETMFKTKLDLKFLEDLLLSDIQTALTRLQDTLKRVDLGAFVKYNSALDSTNKLHLLRLIANLLAKLKMPEEVINSDNSENKPRIQKRNRSERYTIGVSKEELARARKLLEARKLSPSFGQPIIEFDFKLNWTQRMGNFEKDLENVSQKKENLEKLSENEDNFPEKSPEKQFNQIHEKYMKDAINQQQSLQNKVREPKEDSFDVDRLLENSVDYRLEDNYNEQIVLPFYQQSSCPKYNKFLAKKSRLKRANTIDIPNYLKLQPERTSQNGCIISLKKPIDISDKVISNGTNVIPSFQPKTENDRKFLALINKNNETGPPITSIPCKNFVFSQNSVADKNWNNRFSNIKTAFDKLQNDSDKQMINLEEANSKFDNKNKFMGNNGNDDAVRSIKLSYGPVRVHNGFTHAPTSPFQKIEKLQKTETPAFLKPGYVSEGGSNLQAKLKIFDQEQNPNPFPSPLMRTTGKTIKTAANIFNIYHGDEKQEVTENGQLNYNSFCKQFTPRGSIILNKSNRLELAKSKFMNDEIKNHIKDPIRKIPVISNQNGYFQKSKQKLFKLQQEEICKSRKHQKQYEVYPVNVNSRNMPNLDYSFDQIISDQKSKSQPRHQFQCSEENKKDDRFKFNKEINELVHSSVGVQTSFENYQDKVKFENVGSNLDDAKGRSNNVSIQTLELYDNPQKSNFNYQGNRDLRDYEYNTSLEIPATPLGTRRSLEIRRVDGCRIPLESSLDSSGFLLESCRPLEQHRILLKQTGPPVPERFNYNNALLRNYKTDQASRSKNSNFNYEENSAYVPPVLTRRNSMNKQLLQQQLEDEVTKPSQDEFLPNLEHIQNQDISADGVVTRYTCAIATVSSVPESPEPFDKDQNPEIASYSNLSKKLDTLKVDLPRHVEIQANFDEIQRHNLLQQNLIRKIQEQSANKNPTKTQREILGRHDGPSLGNSTNSFLIGSKATLRHVPESGESRRTQEKINMFEEKNNLPVKRNLKPFNILRANLTPPRINVVSPSKLIQPKFKNERTPFLLNVSPVDSSDEYLMSCANKPSRNIVLTKSESWHQLAVSKNNLYVPSANSGSLLKPPKPKSPSSLKLSKQFEASSSSDNIKKMEERIQRYFQGPVEANREVKSKRTLISKKNSNSLIRSNTMPHLYDDKIFDENTDVEKAFDSLFKETTRADNHY